MWAIIPAAGEGSRIQPLGFSKELLPLNSLENLSQSRPLKISDYLIERLINAKIKKICMVVSPGKSVLLRYYGPGFNNIHISFVVQMKPNGLCDSIFKALPLIRPDEQVIIGYLIQFDTQ